MQMDNSVDFRK